MGRNASSEGHGIPIACCALNSCSRNARSTDAGALLVCTGSTAPMPPRSS